MNQEERKQKIEELQAEIYRLEGETSQEISSQIVPFIKEHCELIYNGYLDHMGISVRDGNDARDLELQLIKLIEGTQHGGFYHFGSPINEYFDARFDDGDITLHFNHQNALKADGLESDKARSGHAKELNEIALREIKKLGLKIRFDQFISMRESDIQRHEKVIDETRKLEKEINQRLDIL